MEDVLHYPLLNFYVATNMVSKKWGKKQRQPPPTFPFLCVEQNAFFTPIPPC